MASLMCTTRLPSLLNLMPAAAGTQARACTTITTIKG